MNIDKCIEKSQASGRLCQVIKVIDIIYMCMSMEFFLLLTVIYVKSLLQAGICNLDIVYTVKSTEMSQDFGRL